MKNLLCFVFVVITFKDSYSQHSISIGPQAALGTNLDAVKTGWGGSIEYVNQFSARMGARISGGYNVFAAQNVDDFHISYLPVRAGIQGFLGDVLFVYGEAGVAFYHDNDFDDSKFSYALGAGYKAPFGIKKQFLQLSTFYNSVSGNNNNVHWFNFRVAYGFGFGTKNNDKK